MKTLHFYLFILFSALVINTGCNENISKQKKSAETPKPIATPTSTNKPYPVEKDMLSSSEKSNQAINPPAEKASFRNYFSFKR